MKVEMSLFTIKQQISIAKESLDAALRWLEFAEKQVQKEKEDELE